MSSRYALKAGNLHVLQPDELVKAECALLNETARRQLLEMVNRVLVMMRSKDETKRYFASVLARHKITK